MSVAEPASSDALLPKVELARDVRDDVALLVDEVGLQGRLELSAFGRGGTNAINQVLMDPELGNDPAAAGRCWLSFSRLAARSRIHTSPAPARSPG